MFRLIIIMYVLNIAVMGNEVTEKNNQPLPFSRVSETNFEMFKEALQNTLNEKNENLNLTTEQIKQSFDKESTLLAIFWLLVGLVTLWVGVRVMRLQSDPDIRAISEHPKHLLQIPINRLEVVVKFLAKNRILSRILNDCNITEEQLKQALAFSRKQPDNIFYVKILQQRLGDCTDNFREILVSPPFYELMLHRNCPLSFPSIYLFFPSQHNKELNLEDYLDRIIVIVTTDPKLQEYFYEYRFKRMINVVVPNLAELTMLLLSPHPLETLTKICANQLHIAHISPYQTEAGISKETGFFGREAILRRIMTPPIKNYLVCGGRQLGKSSLLRAVERYYRKNKTIKCYYIILSGNLQTSERDLVSDFAYALGVDTIKSFDDLVRFLVQPRDFTYIFLIDEVDTFICHDRLKDYPVIRRFLNLSQTHNCFFMLSGFWELYTSSFLESLSPLKNFGEFIQIAGLEERATYELITEPMKLLGVYFEDSELPFEISKLVGRRANLVTSMCHEILQLLPAEIKSVSKEYIDRAANSSIIYSKITMSWGRLVENDEDALLDRMIIYMCALSKERLNDRDIRRALAKYKDYSYTFPQFERALKRLELAYIIKRNLDDNRYDFCVPLFLRQLRETPINEIIELEMMEYRYRKKALK